MRILLSYESLEGFAGSETYTLTVAWELDRLGHDVAMYSPRRGAMAEFARRNGLRVLGFDELPRATDVVISSDAATCHELAGGYAGAVRIFVAHSAEFMLQAPPQLADRCQAVVVMNERVRRTVHARAWHARVVRLRQPIDLLRFAKVREPPPGPRTALVLSNYLDGPRAAMIREACRASGMRVIWVGSPAAQTATPELAMAGAHIVIGQGRGVLEGMSAGRAAYVYGVIGGDGWVTADRSSPPDARRAPPRVERSASSCRRQSGWREQVGLRAPQVPLRRQDAVVGMRGKTDAGDGAAAPLQVCGQPSTERIVDVDDRVRHNRVAPEEQPALGFPVTRDRPVAAQMLRGEIGEDRDLREQVVASVELKARGLAHDQVERLAGSR